MKKIIVYLALLTSGTCIIGADKQTRSLVSSRESSSAPVKQNTFNEQTLTANAELYGNKTANLIELQKIAPFLSRTTEGQLTFAVPSFFGLSNQEIITYLQTLPSSEGTVWETLLKHWAHFKSAQSGQQQTLADEAKVPLSQIRELLANTGFNIDNIVTDATRHAELVDFLRKTEQNNELLMVRSTGREDGKDLSNAGGNTSIASVSPQKNALSSAIQEVLQSYFSEKSIGQRLLGNDKRLFDEPFMAILLQIMIGEIYSISQEVPRSGVMFSPEAEGETPDVVVIQATFGHNEGVVNGLVPADTYYVGPSEIIHPLISIKAKRLAAFPNQPGLDFVDNSPQQKTVSTLDKPAVLQLKNSARAIQQYYDNPVDIEFVLLNNTVYLVQARPLENKTFEASFLSNEFIAQNQAPAISVIPFGTGNSAVRIITNPDQVIITDNIRRALELFLSRPVHSPVVQAVIVGEYGIKNSHEATQFRRLGIPAIFTSELEAVKGLIKKTSTQSGPAMPVASSSTSTEPIEYNSGSILLDTQRALIIPFIPSQNFASPTQTIELGWHSHPIEQKVSLMTEFFPQLTEGILKDLAPQELFKETPTTKLIEIIKNENPEQVKKALKSLLYRIQNTITKMELTAKILAKTQAQTHAKIIPQLKHIFICMVASAHEISETLKNSNAQRLERLYPVVFLEALLRQIPEPLRLVNDYSLSSLIKTETQEQRKVTELQLEGKTMRAHIVQYSKADEGALVPEVKNHFDAYLKALATIENPTLQNQYAQLMLNLSQLNVTQPWLNTSFEHFYTASQGNTELLTHALIKDFQQSQGVLQRIQPIDAFFSTFNPGVFEQPGSFEKQFKALSQTIDNTTAPDLLENLDTTTNLGKIAFLQLMHKTIFSFDSAIKALTGSPEYEKNLNMKADRFKKMLELYLQLLEKWSNIPSIKIEAENQVDNITFSNLAAYLTNIRSEFTTTTTHPSEFQTSNGFNVAGAALGSKGRWNYHVLSKLTLEDIFTLIHQNLLVIEGIFANTTDLKNMRIPELITAARHIIENTSLEEQQVAGTGVKHDKIKLVGIIMDQENLKYIYNMPLRSHGIQLELTYNLKTKKCALSFNFFGQDEDRRFTYVAETVYILNNLNLIAPVIALDNDYIGVRFTLNIETVDQAKQAIEYLKKFAILTVITAPQAFIDLIITALNLRPEFIGSLIETAAKPNSKLLVDLDELRTNRLLKEMMEDPSYKNGIFAYFPAYFNKLPLQKKFDTVSELNQLLSQHKFNQFAAMLLIQAVDNLYNNLSSSTVSADDKKAIENIMLEILGLKVDNNAMILQFVEDKFLQSNNKENVILGFKILGYRPPAWNSTNLMPLIHVALKYIDLYKESDNPTMQEALKTAIRNLVKIDQHINLNTLNPTDSEKIKALENRFIPSERKEINYGDFDFGDGDMEFSFNFN